MTEKRLTPEREARIRRFVEVVRARTDIDDSYRRAYDDLIAELDAVRRERDEAVALLKRWCYDGQVGCLPKMGAIRACLDRTDELLARLSPHGAPPHA